MGTPFTLIRSIDLCVGQNLMAYTRPELIPKYLF